MRLCTFATLFALSVSVIACADDPSVDEGAEIDDDSKQDAASRPVGTFVRPEDGGAPFARLVLKSDGTFYREDIVLCNRAPCPPQVQRGTVKFTRSGNYRYIRFRDESGAELDRWAYRFGAPADLPILSLRAVNTQLWQDLELGEAFCEAASDCDVQGLGHVECVGAWTCSGENTCAYSCGVTCGDAGGACRQPSDCLDKGGEIVSGFSCGGMNSFGAACCML